MSVDGGRHTTWAGDVNQEYSTYTASVNSAYATMTTSVVDARNTHVKETLDDDDSTEDGVAGLLPDISDPAAAARAETQRAQAEQDYLEAKAAAELRRAIDVDAAAGDVCGKYVWRDR